MTYFRVAGLNNRAVMTQFKIMSHQIGKHVSQLDNEVVLDFQQKLYLHCVQKDPFCEEANINLILLLWKRGKIMDDRVCDEIYQRIDDRLTAQLLILAFRKANRYQVDQTFEQSVMKQEPSDGLALIVHQVMKSMQDSALKDNTPSLFSRSVSPWANGMLHTMLVHISQAIPINKATEKQETDSKDGKAINPMRDVKRICFSKNEKYMVMITQKHANVYLVCPGRFEMMGQVELPKTVDYKTCDEQMLKSLAKEQSQPITVDALQATATLDEEHQILVRPDGIQIITNNNVAQ